VFCGLDAAKTITLPCSSGRSGLFINRSMRMSCNLVKTYSNPRSVDFTTCPEAEMTTTGAANEIRLCPGEVVTSDGVRHPGSTIGTDGDDVIRIGTRGANFAIGNDGNDRIWGNWGGDEIRGGKGNDVLDGRGGNDKYIWKVEDFGGRDKVSDFWRGDKIIIDGLLSDDATREQQLARLEFKKSGRLGFSINILSEDGNETLQGIDFSGSGIIPLCASSSHDALSLLLEQGAIQFTNNEY
jgi:hypothetical protein